MCCVCETSSLGLSSSYWYPADWDKALKRAVDEAKYSNNKHRVYRQVFSSGNWGWKIERLRNG